MLRVFDMTYGDGGWTLMREDSDFHQRFIALWSAIASTVGGRRRDAGNTWRKDFDLIFERRG